MKKTTIKKHAIWWAVDPFHDNEIFHHHALKVLTPFARALSTFIYPVTYLDTYRALEPSGQRFPLLPLASDSLKALKSIAKERLTHLLRKAPKDIIGSPIILSNEPETVPSLRDRVEAISSAALKDSAVFVAMHSHSYVGLKRFYMGSFAETFMLYSNAPTFIFNPNCEVSAKLRQIVFPTDFSEESINSFNILQNLFSTLKSSLSIVHIQAWFISTKISNPQMHAELENQRQENERAIQILVQKARKHGIKSNSVILSGSDSASSSILKFSRKNKTGLIALAAQSGPLRTMLMGATSRKIVRESQCPVLVCRVPPRK